MFSTVLFLIVVALIITVNSTTAQTPTETPTPTPTPTVTTIPTPSPILTPASTPPSISKSTSEIRVINVYRFGQQEGNTGIGNTAGKTKTDIENAAGIGDIIVIKVSNLQSLVDKAKCLDKNNDKVQNCQEQEIALFLEGRKINGITPISGAPRLEDQTLQFRLQRNTDNGDTWADLLGAPPFFTDKFFKRPTQVSVGLENGYAEPTDIIKDKKFNLVRIRDWLFWPCLFGLLGLVIGMWCLVNKSDIVRDFAPRPSDPKQKPFSLARCQMAFWFFLVIASFVFIWLITGAYDTITPSVLGLISIASGTALGAAAIDVSKPEERESRTSKGWWNDIITDTNDGMSFHRFQIFVWTIVLGAIFLYSVWSRLSMPEFSSTLLALQGISAGTYLGFKIPEKP